MEENRSDYEYGVVVGSPSENKWCQAWAAEDKGEFAAVLVKLKRDGEEINLASRGIGVIDKFKEYLIENREKKERVGRDLEEKLRIEGANTEYVLLWTDRGKVATLRSGEVEVFICRQGKVGRLVPPNEYMEGLLMPGDRFILISRETRDLLSKTNWGQLTEKGLEALEEISMEVKAASDNSGVVAIVMQSKAKEEVKKVSLQTLRWKEKLYSLIQTPLKIEERQLKRNRGVGVAIVLLLLLGITTGIYSKAQRNKEEQFNSVKTQLVQRLTEARSLSDLNPERAITLIKAAREGIEQYQPPKEKEYEKDTEELKRQVEMAEQEILRKTEVSVNGLIDTEVLEENFVPGLMSIYEEGDVVLLDSKQRSLWKLSLSDKSSSKLELGEVNQPIAVASSENKVYVLTKEGVIVPEGKNNTPKAIISPDDFWQDPALLGVYGGSVYVMDKALGEIWKYPALDKDEYGARRRWFAPGITTDLTFVTSMTIDGDIWIITSSGKLERYRRGAPLTFEIVGLPYVEQNRLSNPRAIFVDEKDLFIAENGAGRIVRVNKEDGKFVRQYQNEVFREATSLVVEDNKCYVLVEGKIIWFEL